MTVEEGNTALSPTLNVPEGAEVGTVAGGCFWGVEHMYHKYYDGKGLIDTKVGYMGGDVAYPKYKQVLTDTTGHCEVLQFSFDPKIVSYEELIQFFYRIHDATSATKQGRNEGRNYRSAVFFHSPEQERIAKEQAKIVSHEYYEDVPIASEITPATIFWDAEEYHQMYFEKGSEGYHCPSHYLREKPAKQV
ncbi:hypothetical protein CANCADRAFT_32387 [Tortispora caseinolytica NRRL Y-17796]|uniref:peptide-methionine (S)-S-oxide reductase n=1 Tax=Tortispora caseinolytica NRRL Y-17796 TaxID=767744 RepID=A0A1E4TBA6_9ASCO|nr:hypothetical protein CANCADRAFT_32387 [Tortispora caseinolytica NRRL Y-17796]